MPEQVTRVTARSWRRPLDAGLRDAYLARLGWSAPPRPSVRTLVDLHAAQVRLVPYEVVWIALGETRSIEPLNSLRYLVAGRGGYCYHLNGALAVLLDWLGFDVHLRVGGTQGHADATAPGATGTHMVVEVHGLPTTANPGGRWLADAGLGDGLREPLPLVEGLHAAAPFRFGLRPSPTVPGGWRFDHDPGGAFAGMDFGPGEASIADFAEQHRRLSTAPTSGFVRTVTVARRDGDTIHELRGLAVQRISPGGEDCVYLTTRADYFAALADVFLLPLSDVERPRLSALWNRLREDHERYLLAQVAQ
ncbi:arylamine N-acetyltransferase family protein [Actinokineospora sp. G85]|uniref:arylamine N-acetyltransferase family protein n=1 Tax=Actinokineospora sp. G85 TaxID=3406626 RepID=UPI003C737E2F